MSTKKNSTCCYLNAKLIDKAIEKNAKQFSD